MQCLYFMCLHYPICIPCMTIFQSPCLITVSGTLQHCQDGYGEVQNKHGSPHIGNSFTLIKMEEKFQPELRIKYLHL